MDAHWLLFDRLNHKYLFLNYRVYLMEEKEEEEEEIVRI